MKFIRVCLFSVLFFCGITLSGAADLPTPPSPSSEAIAVNPTNPDTLTKQKEYHIGTLDLLDIRVLYSDEVSRVVRVDSRGNISFPLLGVVKAAGLTTYELEQLIAGKLSVDLIQRYAGACL